MKQHLLILSFAASIGGCMTSSAASDFNSENRLKPWAEVSRELHRGCESKRLFSDPRREGRLCISAVSESVTCGTSPLGDSSAELNQYVGLRRMAENCAAMNAATEFVDARMLSGWDDRVRLLAAVWRGFDSLRVDADELPGIKQADVDFLHSSGLSAITSLRHDPGQTFGDTTAIVEFDVGQEGRRLALFVDLNHPSRHEWGVLIQ